MMVSRFMPALMTAVGQKPRPEDYQRKPQNRLPARLAAKK